jgi:hypothetical protein
MATTIFADTLESRLLMSASATTVLSTAVEADQLQIKADLLKFKADCAATDRTLFSDVLAIKTDDPKQAPTIMPLVKKMRKDLIAMWTQLHADRLAEKQNVLADESVIAGDRLKILKDQGTSLETADHAKLLADQIKLQNDMIAGLDARIATRQADYNTIFNDGQAVITAVGNNGNLAADVTKWVNDRTTCMTTLTGDLNALVADRTKLVADLTAEQSAT